MAKDIDFSGGRRGAVLDRPGKTRITIMLDDDVLEYFRGIAEGKGVGYQTQINAVLKQHMNTRGKDDRAPLTAATLRRILREELSGK